LISGAHSTSVSVGLQPTSKLVAIRVGAEPRIGGHCPSFAVFNTQKKKKELASGKPSTRKGAKVGSYMRGQLGVKCTKSEGGETASLGGSGVASVTSEINGVYIGRGCLQIVEGEARYIPTSFLIHKP
jgi:hypothetical protein